VIAPVVWRRVLADDRVSLLVMEAEFGRPLFLTTACRRLRSDGVTVRHVRVQAAPGAVRLVQEQGGQLYVWAKRSRCSTARSPSSRRRASLARGRSVAIDADGIELYFDQSLGNPEELVIEAKGRRRKHVHAYWDGCAYVV
jgi:hypothetical protein